VKQADVVEIAVYDSSVNACVIQQSARESADEKRNRPRKNSDEKFQDPEADIFDEMRQAFHGAIKIHCGTWVFYFI
jgi:hypothetical protein